MRILLIILAVLSLPSVAEAAKWLDYLRKYDLNDYGLGLAVTNSQNPYAGADDSTFAYPYLTSFVHPAMSDTWLVARDGGLALRWITDGGWEFAAAGRIQTLGFGNHDSDQLQGIGEPKWTIELGPSIGLRRWPVQVHLTSFFEPTDRHDGVASHLSFSYPMQWSRGYVVPKIDFVHQDSNYTEYYYAVSPEAAMPNRPEYEPGSATNTELRVVWGYKLSEKWLLSGKIGYEILADEIRNSPIVDRGHLWSFNLGLAYDADIFNPSNYEFVDPDATNFDLRLGVFHTNVRTRIGRESADGIPGDEIDLEKLLGESGNENVMQVDAVWRFGHFHRLETGYFELVRSGIATLPEDLEFGENVFVSGTEIESRSHFKSFRLGYAYSFLRDAQKEFGVMAGIHFSSFDSIISSSLPDDREKASLDAPLPVVGLHGSVNAGEKTVIAARLQFFRTDFDQYEGSMNYFTIDIQRRIGERLNLGLGYNFYQLKLRSSEEDLNGYIDIQHRGPIVFLGYNF